MLRSKSGWSACDLLLSNREVGEGKGGGGGSLCASSRSNVVPDDNLIISLFRGSKTDTSQQSCLCVIFVLPNGVGYAML